MFGIRTEIRNKKIRTSELIEQSRIHYQQLKALSKESAKIESKSLNEQGKRKNSTCPACSSKNVNDRIKRTQGEFKSEGSISGVAALGFGVISGRSSGSGSIDTNEVNKCNDCEHEWKKGKEWNYIIDKKSLDSNFSSLLYLLQDYEELNNLIFDKDDLNETFNSLEEKKAAKLKSIKEGYRYKRVKRYFKDIPIECIYKIAVTEIFSTTYFFTFQEIWNVKVLEDMGLKHIIYSV